MPWLYIGTSPLKCAYVWTTAVKCIYVGTTKVRPAWKTVDFLLVGWGGSGWQQYNQYNPWAWGWGWWFIECFNYLLTDGSYTVTIGRWWCARNSSVTNYNCVHWCSSCFNWIEAYWWWAGKGAGVSASACFCGWSGGWWSWQNCWYAWGTWCSWQWNNGWCWVNTFAWWGGGAGTVWVNGANNKAWNWGCWKCSCMSWACCWYSWGGGWGASCDNDNYVGLGWCGGWWKWSRYCTTCSACPATYYGGGWWWSGSRKSNTFWGNWYQWVFILRYPASCGYSITWGNCKYACTIWGVSYCIHCFTSNWTLTVS